MLNLVSRGKGVIKMKFINYCIAVCSFKDGVACRTEDSRLQNFNTSLELKNTFYSVSAFLTSYYQSKDVFLIYGSTHICRLRGNDIKEITIHSPNAQSVLGVPMFGNVHLNVMFCRFWLGELLCLYYKKVRIYWKNEIHWFQTWLYFFGF